MPKAPGLVNRSDGLSQPRTYRPRLPLLAASSQHDLAAHAQGSAALPETIASPHPSFSAAAVSGAGPRDHGHHF